LYLIGHINPKPIVMKKKCFLSFVFLCFCIAAICQTTAATDTASVGPVQVDTAETVVKGTLSRKEMDLKAKALTPAEGKALIYILRPTGFGALIRMGVECDSVHIGSTKAENYVYAMLDPGTHTLMSKAENHSSLEVTLEAGKIYYVKQQVKMGFAFAETGLKLVDEQEGQKYLKKCKLAKDNVASK
jgi:hypothetical protein